MTSRSLLWYLLVGSRGGANRIRLLDRLRAAPMNANELAASLGLDYRTVRHHLTLLESAGAVVRPLGGMYGSPYEVTAYLMAQLPALEAEQRHRGQGRAPRPRPLRGTLGWAEAPP
ncbi:MAG: winged helix-turn-helix domain-containing protein [Thermoplasmata archaeon]|nr:winged helix-turn-helix domain-containing protein [Thermoplasmata archaeon]